MNIIIYSILSAIMLALGVALFRLLQSKSEIDPAKMAKALTIRIGLSIFLFLFLIICFLMGWIKPHGINPVALESEPIYKNKQK